MTYAVGSVGAFIVGQIANLSLLLVANPGQVSNLSYELRNPYAYTFEVFWAKYNVC